VDAILQGYLRLFRRRGGLLKTGAEVLDLQWGNGVWQVQTGAGQYTARTLVNAASAWAETVARMAGLGELGIIPMRRTALLIDVPPGYDSADWPMDGGEPLGRHRLAV
jgi:D-arginine dehydrogenase